MTDKALATLARAAGLLVNWTDADGHARVVRRDTLRAVLSTLGHPAESPAQIMQSRSELRSRSNTNPTLITAVAGEAAVLCSAAHVRIRRDGGPWQDVELSPTGSRNVTFRAPAKIGYYEMDVDGSPHAIAVAPPRCFEIADAAPGRKLAALSIQLYALRGGHSEGFGDFAALREFTLPAARHGINAIAISPTHAGFAADRSRFSPYGPSSRFFLDPLYADIALVNPELAKHEPTENRSSASLIDWAKAKARKFGLLRTAYRTFIEGNGEDKKSFQAFCSGGGTRLREHAIFEALDAHFRKKGLSTFHAWPTPYRNSRSREVREFVERHAKEVQYHLFLQWLTARSATAAQDTARRKMAIGLISDVAVGLAASGSHAWSRPGDLLSGLSIGAPPDAFNAQGQDWGLTTLSPFALNQSGYDSFIETIRAAMRHAGGIRIDHAMGLRRLWVLPQGASPREGVYITYPETDLLRLIALESWLNKAIVIGEDLGTVPEGFRPTIAGAGILGMRVLWFERNGEGKFIAPNRWDAQAAALTTTHDLPTVAGWWRGRDIEWRRKIRDSTTAAGAERHARKKDRSRLWTALIQADCAIGAEPAPKNPEPVLDGALCYVSNTSSPLAMASIEDILAHPEQPNFPGTTNEHPNWRRRLPRGNIWSDAKVRARVARLTAGRGNSLQAGARPRSKVKRS